MPASRLAPFPFLLALAGCAGAPAAAPASPPVAFAEPVAAAAKRTGRTVEVTLVASLARVELDGRPVEMLTYNGAYPGPTLEAREGDRLVVHFRNDLSEPTNLHWHGLQVPVDQDAATEVVAPGGTREFAFDLLAGSAGTYWYHPHVHGSVSSQVARGLLGAIRVLPAEDPLPAAVGDTLVVLSDVRVGADGRTQAAAGMERANGFEGELALVNGRRAPALALRPGETRRLRLLNASAARYYRLATPGRPLTLVATDGGFLERPYPLGELLLTPGERAEVLIQAPAAADAAFALAALPYARGTMAMGPVAAASPQDPHAGHRLALLATAAPAADHGAMDHAAMGHAVPPPAVSASTGTPVLALPVAGEPAAAVAAPAALRALTRLMPGGASRVLTLSEDHMAMDFRIDGQRFEMGRVDAKARIGTTETWEIRNTGHMDHPFHLHGFGFQVLERGGRPEPYLAWKDTVNVKAAETVRFAVRFDQFPGPRVYHCHVLDHEDLGMMGVLEVAP